MRGYDGFEIGDLIELLDGKILKIIDTHYCTPFIYKNFQAEWILIGENEDNQTFEFYYWSIKRLIKRSKEPYVIFFTCPNCQKTSTEYKEAVKRFHRLNQKKVCAKCYADYKENEFFEMFDKDGFQKNIKLKQIFLKNKQID